MFLIAAFAIAASGFTLTNWMSPLPTDKIDAQQKQQLEKEFARLGSISLVRVAKADEDAVLDTMKLDPSTLQQLKRSIAQGTTGNETSLAWISLWDFAAQDGDVVTISSAGYSISVLLENKTADFAVPVDASRQIKITGLQDGGGGITLAIKNGKGSVSMPVLGVGQSYSIPVGL